MKYIKNISLVVLLFFGNSNFLQAQKVEKLYEKGMKAFYREKFSEAEGYFLEIESTGKSFKDSKYRLELSYLVQPKYRERDLSIINSFKVAKTKSDKFYFYWLGRIYVNRYMFPEAVNSWETFLSMKNQKSDFIVDETKDFISQAEYRINYFDNPVNYEVHQMSAPINSKYDELTPVFSQNKGRLLFASERNDPQGEQFQIFQSEMNDSGWKEPVAIDAFGSFPEKYSNIEIVNEDGKLFLFKDEKKGDLYFSEYSDNSWTVPIEFDSKITSTKMGSHFYINEHEDRIIFSSPNKLFALDLMESYKNPKTGEWEKPHLFSDVINTGYDEDSPFLSVDEKTIYFASDGPSGLGGFDIYVSYLDTVKNLWSVPINMGWPINSPDDELYFKMNPDGASGYLTSNRLHSLGGFDIYYFWGIQKTKIQGKVLHAHDDSPVKTGEIRFHPTQYLDEYFQSKIDENGNYMTEIISNEIFKVEIIQGYDTILTQPFSVEEIEGKSVTHLKDFHVTDKNLSEEEKRLLEEKYAAEQIEPVIAKAPNSIKKDEIIKPAPPIKETSQMITPKTKPYEIPNITNFSSRSTTRLTNIYFEYGTSQLRKDSDTALNNLYAYLVMNSTVKIEIAGHADNIGTKEVNQIVSKNRAESVKAWLIQKGIANNRIQTVGFGESRPLASNDDEKDGRALNRRIEVRLIN
jgi:outer membrane protein OmpA-like peptidoglycan-associated protein